MAAQTLLGDLNERPDGSFDGWCWAPDRPDERLVVDLLVNDTLAISMVAAIFRRDLQASGYGDGRHGFVLRLPANTPGLAGEALITARERRTGHIFGRVLRAPSSPVPTAVPAVDAVEQATADVWRGLAAAAAPWRGMQPSQRLRAGFALLADRLRARGTGGGAPQLVLPDITAPDLTVAFRAGRADAALARIEALAPALALLRAEVLVIDPGADAAAAALPARVRHVRYVRDPAATGNAAACNLALAQARGAHLIWLGDAVAAPSAAALLALADALQHSAAGLWLGPRVRAALANHVPAPSVGVALPARLGLVLCLDRMLGDTLGPLEMALDDGGLLDCADWACKARLLGVPVHDVAEPVAPLEAARGPAGSPFVRALFQSRWGMPVAAETPA